MKKFKKMMLAVIALLYVGITVTIMIPEVPDNSDNSQVETCSAAGQPTSPNPFGPFDDDDERH